MGLFGVVPPANASNLGSGFGRFEVKRPYNFKVEWAAEGTGDIKTLLDTSNVQTSLGITLKSINRPDIAISEVPIIHGNEKFKYAGRSSLANDGVQAVFHDVIPGKILAEHTDTTGDAGAGLVSPASIFWQWSQYIQNFGTGQGHLSNNYKATCYVSLYTPDYSTIIEKWVYLGMWPKQYTASELSMDSEEPANITVSFACDKMFRVAATVANTTPGEYVIGAASGGGIAADTALTAPDEAEAGE